MGEKVNLDGLLYEGKEPFIFISYAHKDEDVVLPMIESLLWRGFRAWYDLGIPHGSNWDDVVADHLNQSSVMIACVSSGFVDSLYCCNEIRTAIQKQIPILMLFLEDENSFKLPSGIEMNTVSNNRMYRGQYLTQERFLEALYKEPILQQCRQEIAPDTVPENNADQYNLQRYVRTSFGKSAKQFLYNAGMISFSLPTIIVCIDSIREYIPLQLMNEKNTLVRKMFEDIKMFRAGSLEVAAIQGSKMSLGILGGIAAALWVAGLIVLFKYCCISFYSKKNIWVKRYQYNWYCHLLVITSSIIGVFFYPEILYSLIFTPIIFPIFLCFLSGIKGSPRKSSKDKKEKETKK